MTALKVQLAAGAPDAATRPAQETDRVDSSVAGNSHACANDNASTGAPPPDDPICVGQVLLTEMVQAHQVGLWRYLRYLGANRSEADDLTQETFLSVARSQFEHRSQEQTASYLRTAARNQLLMLRRREQRQVETVQLEAAEGVWAGAVTDQTGDAYIASLSDCVDQLDGRPRQVIDLQYRNGASRQEIAEQLEMKPDGVKTLLRRTRQLLRECIERRLSCER